MTIAVQVNGKLRDTLTAPKGAAEGASSRRLRWPARRSSVSSTARKSRKVIVVPDRLVNIVA